LKPTIPALKETSRAARDQTSPTCSSSQRFSGGANAACFSRVLGEFPRDSSNALFPLATLEAARCAVIDAGGDLVVGIDVAGPERDRTVAVACAGGTILDTMVSTATDSSGPCLAFLRKHAERLRVVKVDSTGLGFFLQTIIRNAGYRCEGLNAASAAEDKERVSNLKAECYWNLREKFRDYVLNAILPSLKYKTLYKT
jgi:hypothetical protein